jgi:hypothetical protein
MQGLRSCHTISQNSRTVPSMGPCVAMYDSLPSEIGEALM